MRSNTRVSQSLTRFLDSLDIPLIATLRDTQNYVRSAEIGVGVYEMPRWQVQQDLDAVGADTGVAGSETPRGRERGRADAKLAAIERSSSEPERPDRAARRLDRVG